MILNCNIIFEVGFSIESGKNISKVGECVLKNVVAVRPFEDNIYIYPKHNMNVIFTLDKTYSKLPSRLLGNYIHYINNIAYCFIDRDIYITSDRTNVFRLKEEERHGIPLNFPNALIIFKTHQKAIIKALPKKNQKHFLTEEAYERYATFIKNMNLLHDSIKHSFPSEVTKNNYIEQNICLKRSSRTQRIDKYLSPNFFFSNALVIKFTIDSIGKSKEIGNFFIPITYEAIYFMLEIPFFHRILQGNSTILNYEILSELYQKYFLVKLGLTADVFGIAWTIDFKSILETLHKNKIALLQFLFRALSITIRQKYAVFYISFDLHTFSVSISAMFFPIKYSAYIDNHGKYNGQEKRQIENLSATYF